MKPLVLIRFFLSSILIMSLTASFAQEKKQKESRAARKERQKQEDKVNYKRVLTAFENERWAFETPQMVDEHGTPIEGQHHPNVVGFNGRDLAAWVVYRIEQHNYGNSKPSFRYDPVSYEGPVVKQEHQTDKKGRIIYKYQVGIPFRAEVTVMLFPDTPLGIVNISADRGHFQYTGRFIPIHECWYYLKSDR